jgi:hypothetical protein
MSIFEEYSYVSEPADRAAFVGYHHTLPGNPSLVNFVALTEDLFGHDIEEILLDRFRDVIMEVEGIQDEDPYQAEVMDIEEILKALPEHPMEPMPTITHPQYGPVWIAPQTYTTDPQPGQFYVGDNTDRIYIGDPPQDRNQPYTVEGNGFTISTLGDGTWEASR